MIKEDGEKYACEACIRGHRVSQCQHKDRELHHINRKGRPVTQCPHCRGLRKARATHVKCICGEKTSSGDRTHCGCMTGNKCICALIKDEQSGSDDGVHPLAKLHTPPHGVHKPTISSRNSESSIPKIRNGHHAPMHRLNNAAHESGMPYQVRRLNSVGVPYSLAHQSVDHLPLQTFNTNQSQPSTSEPNPDGTQGDRPFKSEHNSPVLGSISMVPYGGQLLNQETDIDGFIFNNTPRLVNPSRYSLDDFSDYLTSINDEPFDFVGQQITSANLEQGPFNWDDYNINTPFTLNGILPQAAAPTASSIASHDQPGLSRSSSGTVSDAGDVTGLVDFAMLTASTTHSPLDFDAAWATQNPFANPGDDMSLRAQPSFQDLKDPTYPSSIGGMSPSSGAYFADASSSKPVGQRPESFIQHQQAPEIDPFSGTAVVMPMFADSPKDDAVLGSWGDPTFEFSQYGILPTMEQTQSPNGHRGSSAGRSGADAALGMGMGMNWI